MRVSAGGFYEIAGTDVRPATNGPLGPVTLKRWRERQADLWTESATIAHAHRPLTAEDAGLWHAMWRELETIGAAIARLEDPARVPPAR